MNNLWKLIISLIIPQLAGGIGSIFTSASVGTWYKTLKKSPLNPPSWVFGPVWTTLFLLMGIALYLVWRKDDAGGRTLAFWIFGIQLALNVLWSLLFFGLHRPDLALMEIAVLWLAILANIIIFYSISKPAALLLLPYLLWVSFAAYLNYDLWRLN
jgi:tryptophan-rich sensory protein